VEHKATVDKYVGKAEMNAKIYERVYAEVLRLTISDKIVADFGHKIDV
jgi:hypothetical protein